VARHPDTAARPDIGTDCQGYALRIGPDQPGLRHLARAAPRARHARGWWGAWDRLLLHGISWGDAIRARRSYLARWAGWFPRISGGGPRRCGHL